MLSSVPVVVPVVVLDDELVASVEVVVLSAFVSVTSRPPQAATAMPSSIAASAGVGAGASRWAAPQNGHARDWDTT